jgi:tetratricopeptide (TPR) repeat protein
LAHRACIAIRAALAALVLSAWMLGASPAHSESAAQAVARLHAQVSQGDTRVETLRQLAHALSETGDLAGAEAALQAGLKREPRSAPAQRDLGRLYLETNRTAQALPLLVQALGSEPEDPQTRDALSYALYQVGDAVGSLEVANRGAPLGPAHAEALVEAARFYTQGGHPEAAERALAKAHELAPDSPAVSSAQRLSSAMKATGGEEAPPRRRSLPSAVVLAVGVLMVIGTLRAFCLLRGARAERSAAVDEAQAHEGSFQGRLSRASWRSGWRRGRSVRAAGRT